MNIQEAEGFARGHPPGMGCPHGHPCQAGGRVLSALCQRLAWRKELILWFHLARACPGQAEEVALTVHPGWHGSAIPPQQGAMQLGFLQRA